MSDTEDIISKKRKKGIRNTEEYKAVKIKRSRLSGQPYRNYRGNLVPGNVTGEQCTIFSEEIEQELQNIIGIGSTASGILNVGIERINYSNGVGNINRVDETNGLLEADVADEEIDGNACEKVANIEVSNGNVISDHERTIQNDIPDLNFDCSDIRIYNSSLFEEVERNFGDSKINTPRDNSVYPNETSISNNTRQKFESSGNEFISDILAWRASGPPRDTESPQNPEKQILYQRVDKIAGSVKYNKLHSCFICHDKCIELKHKDNFGVARILAKDKKCSERRNGFIELIIVGDFHHNIEVLMTKEGELILERRPEHASALSVDDYGPCPYCLGFMLQHIKKCTKRCMSDSEIKKSSILLESKAITNVILCEGHTDFQDNVLKSLKNDNISYLCKTDKLISGVDMMLYEEHGGTQNQLIRQTMRQMERLLQELKNTKPDFKTKTLAFFIAPKYFDHIVDSVETICEVSRKKNEKMEYGIPSLALKLGHSLRKCVAYLRGQSLRNGLT
ncbi:unnamed protein product [Phaedon cochleariae]|uniref:Uncharacterized protein n=1 Tax=Phaedon cochleariae TaxID=80249 RepID=A0A9N9SFW3_PHACE|nr:unnamed protein product [Phaedon cochleariae]